MQHQDRTKYVVCDVIAVDASRIRHDDLFEVADFGHEKINAGAGAMEPFKSCGVGQDIDRKCNAKQYFVVGQMTAEFTFVTGCHWLDTRKAFPQQPCVRGCFRMVNEYLWKRCHCGRGLSGM